MLGALLDGGGAAMIEHELDVGADIDEGDRLVDLVRSDAEVERSPGSRQPADVDAKKRRLADRVGRYMQDAAETSHEGIGELALEESGKVGAFRPA